VAQLDGKTLDELYALIASRRGGDPARSYTARLLAEGVPAIARKLGEEAVETLIEALAAKPNPDRLAAESADLLYHLLALWAAAGIEPERVWRALESRRGTSGLEEKARRET
jgi:phosphoribosyl-ATP pyrophosphohydrolase